MRLLHSTIVGLVLYCLTLAPAALRAGDGIPVPTEPVADSTTLLGQEFKDESNGFKVRVPFGVRIFQRAGLELMSFVHDNKGWAGSVEMQLLDKDAAPDAVLVSRSAALNKTFTAVQILDSRQTIISGKPSGILIASLKDYPVLVDAKGNPVRTAKIALIRYELLVQTATNQYFSMTFFAPLAQKEQADPVFKAMVESFEVLDRKALEERRLAAAKAGRDWLAHIRAEDLNDRIVREPQLFRIKIENQDVGYLRIDEGETPPTSTDRYKSTDGYKGIIVMANSRTFPDNGTLVLGSNTSFWAYRDQGSKFEELPCYSTWDDRSGTEVPSDGRVAAAPPAPTDIRPGQIIHGVAELPPEGVVKWHQEIGTLKMSQHPRVDDKQQVVLTPQYDLQVVLLDPFTPSHTEPLQWTISTDDIKNSDSDPAHPPLVKPIPMPKPLEYVWPRLVDLTKESQMAMVVFNPLSLQKKLGLRILTVGKQETINVDSTPMRLTRLTDELGADSRTLWVDEKGTIKMIRTSDGTVMVPTTEEKMRQLWAAKLAKFK